MSSRKNYTIEQFKEACEQSFSIAQVCRNLGLAPRGGNYFTVRRKVILHDINTSHWTGQLWSKGKLLKVDVESYSSNERRKKFLASVRGLRCESCGLSEWLGKPISIELDHIDGNRYNNGHDNLRLLCPNCHSQTSTWKRG